MNQVPVKWAHPDNLRQWQNSIDRIPVVPLSALREVVEGLRQLADPFYGSSEELDEWTLSKSKEPFSQWLAQRLLAQLAEIPTQDAGEKEA